MGEIQQYFVSLNESIPIFDLPKPRYRSEGAFGLAEGKFKGLLQFHELKKGVVQSFKEIGNALAFVKILSACLEPADQVGNQTLRFRSACFNLCLHNHFP